MGMRCDQSHVDLAPALVEGALHSYHRDATGAGSPSRCVTGGMMLTEKIRAESVSPQLLDDSLVVGIPVS